VSLVEKALQLNPNYPYWYNQALRYVYYFGRRYDKSLDYAKRITEPFAVDHVYLAAASALMGDLQAAKASAAEVARMDPDWTVEKYLSDAGGYPEEVARLLIDGARKAGVPACVPLDRMSGTPNLIRLQTCDSERGLNTAG
jgi:hypothetical protein